MVYGAKLEIPAFTSGKSQLSQIEVEYSKQLSTVRIHVEKVIGHLNPVTILKHADDIDVSNFDKVLTVCAALTNLTGSVV